MSIVWKMRRHPIQDDADALLMQMVDQEFEVSRRSITIRRRKVAGGLIPPRAEKRMFHDRHKLNVSEAQASHVISKVERQFAIGQRPIVLLRDSTPRAQMHFIN